MMGAIQVAILYREWVLRGNMEEKIKCSGGIVDKQCKDNDLRRGDMMISSYYKNRLLELARNQFPGETILPCGGYPTLDDCFTFWQNQYVLWFNTSKDNSTRVVTITA